MKYLLGVALLIFSIAATAEGPDPKVIQVTFRTNQLEYIYEVSGRVDAKNLITANIGPTRTTLLNSRIFADVFEGLTTIVLNGPSFVIQYNNCAVIPPYDDMFICDSPF